MEPLIIIYACADLFLAIHISFSNFIVFWVYIRSKHVRTPTNTYIFSLAIADFLAGALGIPITVFSVLTRQPYNFLSCLTVHLCLCILCTVSTFHLLAIAIDKYITICWRRCQFLQYSSRHNRVKIFIALAWVLGSAIASMPLFDAFGFVSNTKPYFRNECHFTVVVDYRYLVYVVFFGTIVVPSVIIAFCYIAIYKKIYHEERQIKVLLHASERQRRLHNRQKIIRILLILVLTYAFCWYPLYIFNTIDFFLPSNFWLHSTPVLTLTAVVLTHFNCALNPLIYAYGIPGFKHSLRRFLPFCSNSEIFKWYRRHCYFCDTACLSENNSHTQNYFQNINGEKSSKTFYNNKFEKKSMTKKMVEFSKNKNDISLNNQNNNLYNCDNTNLQNKFINNIKLDKKHYLTNLKKIGKKETFIKNKILNESTDSNSYFNANKILDVKIEHHAKSEPFQIFSLKHSQNSIIFQNKKTVYNSEILKDYDCETIKSLPFVTKNQNKTKRRIKFH